ncbi:hypothetical protein DCAR_0205969 [Daucus carota subsp. sativus]|uniref:Uncharacterized protein n=1 Tax=Daucus carota subsp. sativus TaxID=79200 RepID=A0AAF0WC83_DAUCS|nr:hypothetical protein DCAR_0205969 [Daucus carota subsp. sativus]
MTRVKAALQLLLLGILLAMFRPHCAIVCGVNAIRSGDMESMHHSSKLMSGYVPTNRVKENKIPKRPSAPNPVGNHCPPSRI